MDKWRQWRDRRQRPTRAANGDQAHRESYTSDISVLSTQKTTSVPVRTKANAPTANPTPTSSSPASLPLTDARTLPNAQGEQKQETALSGRKVAKKDYWQLAVQELQEEDSSIGEQIAALRNAATAEDQSDLPTQLLHAAEKGRQALEAKRWTITVGSRRVVVHEQFDRLINAIMLFKDVGRAAASLDPLHAGLPFAGFCVLMQASLAS